MNRLGRSRLNKRIMAQLRGCLMVLAIIASLMSFGALAFAGGDDGTIRPPIILTYETNGGAVLPPDFVPSSGGILYFQRTPVKECSSFKGWFYDKTLTQPYNSMLDVITDDLTLYAKWEFAGGSAQCVTASITSTIGTVSAGGTLNETITVGSDIKLAALKAAITPSASAAFEIYNADGITKATVLESGMKIIVTPLVGTHKVTYIITVSPPNLALNKPVTVDSTCITSQNAVKAVDGSVTNDSKWCSKSSNRWLQIDLGSVKQVNQFVIKHASEGGETASYNTKAYNILVSIDGTNWSTVVKVTNNTNGITVNDLPTVSARYIKLNVTTPTQTANTAARIYEVQVFGPTNLAANKPATVDSTCNASQTGSKAVDGNLISDSKWCSKSDNRWLQVDLGSEKQVSQFVIKHASEGGETTSYNTKAYKILVSTDGVKWSSVVNVTNNTGSITVDTITPVSARYIKLSVTTPTQTTNAAARIYEFEVYGEK